MLKRIYQQFYLSGAILIASLLLLFYGEDPGITTLNEDSIGFIEKENQHLSRRSMDDLDWIRISDSDRVFSGDLIFTNQKSIAKINLMNLMSLNLNELTLIKLDKNNDIPKIDLKRGSVSVNISKKTQKIILKVENKEVTITSNGSTDTQLNIHKVNDQFRITNQSGSVTVVSSTQPEKPITIEAGQVLNSSVKSEESTVTRVTLCIEYRSPQNLQEITLNEQEPIHFEWKNTCNSKESHLEIAEDSSFRKVIHRKVLSGTEFNLQKPDFTQGPVFWRIKDPGNPDQFQSFIVKAAPVPETIQLVSLPEEASLPDAMETDENSEDSVADVEERIIDEKRSTIFAEAELNRNPDALETSLKIQPLNEETKTELEPDQVEDQTVVMEGVVANRKLKLSLGAGLTSNQYQDRSVSLTQYSVTPKIAANYVIKILGEKIRLSGNTFFTALPLTTNTIRPDPINNSSAIEKVTMRFLGVNARASYLLPWFRKDWRVEVSGGWYFNSTFITNDYFGYSSVNGPQIFPSVEKDLNNGSTLGAYFKFSPVSGNGTLLNISSNNEVASGAYFLFPRKDIHSTRWSLNADYSVLSIETPSSPIKSTSFTIGGGLQF